MPHVIDMQRIGKDFSQLREILGLSRTEVRARTRDRLSQSELAKIEAGQHGVTTEAKRKLLSEAYGLPLEAIADLAEGYITPEHAASFRHGGLYHRRTRPTLPKAAAIAIVVDGHADGHVAPVDGESKRAAVIAVLQGAAVVNLELCLLYHGPAGLRWSPAVIAIARGGEFGTDHTPEAWSGILDGITKLLAARPHPTTPPLIPHGGASGSPKKDGVG